MYFSFYHNPCNEAPRPAAEGDALKFYPGLHQPFDCQHFPRSFVSINRLLKRKGDFPVNEWILDSAAFSQLNKHADFTLSVAAYAAHIARWSACGTLIAACAQDYMCEPFMFTGQDFKECYEVEGTKNDSPCAKKLRLELEYIEDESDGTRWWELYDFPITDLWDPITVADHQEWTVDRYQELREALDLLDCDTPIMPVIQGYTPEEYLHCLDLYEKEGLLPHGAYVGVGSICKRNSNPDSIYEVLSTIKTSRPDLQLHGFGLKITALADHRIRPLLKSSDSMAWSYSARKQGRDQNDWREAMAYANRIEGIIAEPTVTPQRAEDRTPQLQLTI